jgi:hypothetical protein
MNHSHTTLFAALLCASVLAACGGGGGSAGSSSITPPASAQSGPRVALAYTGTTTLARTRTPQALSGTAVTITYNGKVVGSGTLDASGAATIELEGDVPEGATVTITAGSITASVVLAHTTEDSAVLVQVNSDNTIAVTVASGTQPTASPAPGDPNGSSETEDDHGDPQSVDENNGSTVLPSNLPVSVSATCSTVTLTPLSSAIASMRFEENVEDGDGGSKFKYEGPFTAAMTFPLAAQSARLRIRLFDANNAQLLDLKAPLSAFGASSCASPSPSPTPSA